MSSVDTTQAATQPAAGQQAQVLADESGTGQNFDGKESFIPVTRYALMDRLTRSYAWPEGQADEARRFIRYLDYWRQQGYAAEQLEIQQNYEPFNPDSDRLITRKFRKEELLDMRKALVRQIEKLLKQANYVRIDPTQVDAILSQESAYGLELHVDMDVFEEILMYYRGASSETRTRRNKKKLFMRKEEFDVPIFQRLLVLFKLKPEEVRLREIMEKDRLNRKQAEKKLKKLTAMIPSNVRRDYVYIKMFKNIPRSDMEMCFPNTVVKFRTFDKVKLGVTAGGGLGMGIITTAGKIAAATATPIGMIGATVGLGAVAVRQASSVMNTRQRYMVTMAQNLYFHSMADNYGVVTLMSDRAVEEDVKEDMLLYCVLAKEQVHRDELGEVKVAIEQYLSNGFGIEVDFDLEEALERLMGDGIVSIGEDGMVVALAPREASTHIDVLWDNYLDELPDPARGLGDEVELEMASAEDALGVASPADARPAETA